jgi:2-polyprenyl-3-methyl-5-hydroxy-6-metoxy-1,4-benzoquinol methylase
MELFADQWSTYRSVVDNDLMEHAALQAALEQVLHQFVANRTRAITMTDLGCGDLGLLGDLLWKLPLTRFLGVDLSQPALQIAAAKLEDAPFACEWRQQDLLDWARQDADREPRVDVLYSAFAIHHLDDGQKAAFLREARAHLAPGGIFLWADVFREPGESRSDYLARFLARIDAGWTALGATERQYVKSHVSEFDFPADRAAIGRLAAEAGWSWQWLWRGRHQAEALALLSPRQASPARTAWSRR